MQKIRSSITRLKNKVSEKVPDGNDVFGYPGVHKPEIIDYLEKAYGLTSRIEELRGGFVMAALQRKLAPWFLECNEFLDERVTGKNAESDFDKFLKYATKIHDEIYLTYVIYCSSELRSESEVELALNNLSQAEATYSETNPRISELLKNLERVEELLKGVESSSSEVDSILTGANNTQTKLDQILAQSNVSSQVITRIENDAKSQKEIASNLSATLAAQEKKLKKLVTESQTQLNEVERLTEEANNIKSTNESHLKNIDDTLRMASKYGMAASFKERKDELKGAITIWVVIFLITITAIFITSWRLLAPHLVDSKPPSLSDLFFKLGIIAPLVWLGWMASKQYSYINKIREDYAFKYASALAFEGYKREATEVDRNVLRDLLDVATQNMSLNPLRIYGEDSNHASPAHEFMSKVADKLDAKNLAKEVIDTMKEATKKKILPESIE